MLLNYLRTTRPDLELEKYFNFSAGDFPLQSDPHSPPQLDHSNWGGFTLDATQLVLDEVKIKMKDKSVTFSTTSNLEKSIITALANPKNQKTGIFFNYNIDGVEYSHTSLFYLEKNQSNCNAVFLDTVDVDLYKFFWGEIVASGILKNCKVHFASAPRQMDAYSCASYCIHDFLNIQKMEGDLFASLNEFQKAGLGGGKIRINDTVCIPHEILPPSFMTLAQASKAVLKPYINDLKPYLETMPLAKRDHRKLENSLKNHKKTYSGEHLSDEEWDSLAESFPTLAELYYNQTREINTKPKNTYTKYTSLVLKKLLNDQGPPAPASAPAPLHTR
ncbi:MAG: hypothetical protein ABIQ95_13480, partial [Bdellovibrionia bacterium]